MAPKSSSFLDTIVLRILSFILSGVIVLSLLYYWGQDMKATFFCGDDPQIPISTKKEPTGNAALDACLEKRLGDVKRMKAEGVINDSQFTQFMGRAQQLCEMQNQ